MKYKKRKIPIGAIEIDDKIISGELVEELFACDIAACKGACCIEGDLGAPVVEDELAVMEEIYPKVKPYLRKEGRRAIAKQGTTLRDFTGNFSTPLIEGKECAYVVFKDGIAACGIEQAYEAGDISFQKPVSCHLYPVRSYVYKEVERLNYDRWNICSAACVRGKKEGIPVYEFVKDALIRKYGQEFYDQLDTIAKSQKKDRPES